MRGFIFSINQWVKGRAFPRFLREQEAVTSIEYGMIALLIAVAIVLVVANLGGKVSNLFDATQSAYP